MRSVRYREQGLQFMTLSSPINLKSLRSGKASFRYQRNRVSRKGEQFRHFSLSLVFSLHKYIYLNYLIYAGRRTYRALF